MDSPVVVFTLKRPSESLSGSDDELVLSIRVLLNLSFKSCSDTEAQSYTSLSLQGHSYEHMSCPEYELMLLSTVMICSATH